VAVLEFEDEAALGGYLEHPAHAELASARDPAALSDSFVS